VRRESPPLGVRPVEKRSKSVLNLARQHAPQLIVRVGDVAKQTLDAGCAQALTTGCVATSPRLKNTWKSPRSCVTVTGLVRKGSKPVNGLSLPGEPPIGVMRYANVPPRRAKRSFHQNFLTGAGSVVSLASTGVSLNRANAGKVPHVPAFTSRRSTLNPRQPLSALSKVQAKTAILLFEKARLVR